MNQKTLHRTARIAAITGLAVYLIGCGTLAAQDLVDPPEDQSTTLGGTVTFSAEPRQGGLLYQWLRQWPDRYDVLEGQNSSSLTLTNVSLGDVGFYVCEVIQGDQLQVTRAAALYVSVSVGTSPVVSKTQTLLTQTTSSLVQPLSGDLGGLVTIYSPPVTSSGNQGNNCPGSYVGFVNYTKKISQGWGWAPSANTSIHVASDTTRTDTKISYFGMYADVGCDQTAVGVPHPTISPAYRFTIYFPNNMPSTNAYPITLTGFAP